jgi:hypothetical protein
MLCVWSRMCVDASALVAHAGDWILQRTMQWSHMTCGCMCMQSQPNPQGKSSRPLLPVVLTQRAVHAAQVKECHVCVTYTSTSRC